MLLARPVLRALLVLIVLLMILQVQLVRLVPIEFLVPLVPHVRLALQVLPLIIAPLLLMIPLEVLLVYNLYTKK